MKISYQNSIRDLRAFLVYHFSHNRFYRLMWLVLVGMMVVISWYQVAGAAASFFARLALAALLAAVLSAVIILLIVWLSVRTLSKKQNQVLLTPTTLTLEYDRILVESGFGESEISWLLVQSAKRTQTHLFLYLMEQGAMVIPRRAFENDTAWEQVWVESQDRMQAARRQPPAAGRLAEPAHLGALPLTLSFHLKLHDYLAFLLFRNYRSRLYLGALALWALIGFKPNFDATLNVVGDNSLLYQVIFFSCLNLIPLLFFSLVFGLLVVLSGFVGSAKNTLLTDTQLTVEEAQLTIVSLYGRSELSWAAIQKVRRSGRHIFLFTQQNGAIIIPRRAFASHRDWAGFWQLSQAKVKEMQAQSH